MASAEGRSVILSELEWGSKLAEREMWPGEGDCKCGGHLPSGLGSLLPGSLSAGSWKPGNQWRLSLG